MQRYAMLLVGALLVSVTIAAFMPGVSGGFIFDDRSTIVDNDRVHIENVTLDDLRAAAGSFEPGNGLQSRPLSMITFGINHAVHGLQPNGYKLTGIVIHAVNSVLVFLLAYGLIGTAWHRAPMWSAAAVATAWALHPLQVSTVLYVVQRMESLSLLFVLAALVCYLVGRLRQQEGRLAWPWLACSLPLVALGIAAKESAILFFAYAFAIEATLLRFGAASSRAARAWKWVYLASAAVALIGFLGVLVPYYWVTADDLSGAIGTAERLLTQLRVLPMYLGQMLLPLPSSMPFNYDSLAPSQGWLHPGSTLAGGLLLAALASSAVALRRRMPIYSLGVALFFAGHALTSNVVPLELAFEHRNYFALLGVLLAMSDLVRQLPSRDHPAYKKIMVGAMIGLCGFLTHIRSSIWGDSLLLATEHVSINPASARASADLAAEYLEMTDGYPGSPFTDFAMREFERGSQLPGASIVSDQGLILTAAGAGREIDPEWWERLIHKVEHERITPETTHALFGLLRNRLEGIPLDDNRLTDAFVAFFSRASLPPHSYAQFGDYVLTHVGDQALADQIFVRAVEMGAEDPGYVAHMISHLRSNGRHAQAEAALRRARQLGLPVDAAE